MIVLNGVLNDSAQLQAGMASKKTAFAPFPNTTNWLDLDQRVNGSDELPENDIQPNHPQVRNLRLVLEEKKRKLQTEATKKGNEWMQQVAKVGETVFMHSGVNQIPPSHSQPEEHVYEEINGGLLEEDSPGYQVGQCLLCIANQTKSRKRRFCRSTVRVFQAWCRPDVELIDVSVTS